ncbi:MAG: GlsB/YeaQ/YmgE family stress response membrane protein [Devosia sp.]|nr:GlsB/YeaQ/YmgE family stress response membrane protein [Devosia sp.]
MEGLGWIGTIIVGGLAGWIASGVMKVNTGILLNIVLGILGAVVLNAVLIAIFHTTWAGFFGQLVVALIGACILIGILRAVQGQR